jgi:hypothetical protein
MLFQLSTLLLVSTIYCRLVYSDTLFQCTPNQAKTDGTFKCLDNCDEDHQVTNGPKPRQYCLSYFPNGGNCFLKPYTKPEIMSCGGTAGGNNPATWIIFVGGSNMQMMFKTLIDVMLELPGNAGYDPARYWNAHCK